MTKLPSSVSGRLLFALLTLSVSMANAQMGVTVVTGNPTPVAGGAAFSYTITATNTSAFPVSFSLSDAMPQSVLFLNVAMVGANGGNADCYGPAVGTNGVVQCSNPNFAGNGVVTVTIVAQISPDTASGVRTNTVQVFPRVAAQAVPATASVQQNIVANAQLSLSATANAQTGVGGQVGYNVTLNNNGSSTALNVTIAVTLPEGAGLQSISGTRGFNAACAYRPATHSVVCPTADFASGNHELTIALKAPNKSGVLAGTAEILGAGTGTIAVGLAGFNTTVQPGQPQ